MGIVAKIAAHPGKAAKAAPTEGVSEMKSAYKQMHYAKLKQPMLAYERKAQMKSTNESSQRAHSAIAKRHKTMGRREGAAVGLVVGSATLGGEHSIRGRGARRH